MADLSKLFNVETVGWAAGGAVGAALWKEHRVLGFLAGMNIGAAPGQIMRGDYVHAVGNLAVVGASLIGSRWKAHPVLGFSGAFLAVRLLGVPVITRLLPPSDSKKVNILG